MIICCTQGNFHEEGDVGHGLVKTQRAIDFKKHNKHMPEYIKCKKNIPDWLW